MNDPWLVHLVENFQNFLRTLFAASPTFSTGSKPIVPPSENSPRFLPLSIPHLTLSLSDNCLSHHPKWRKKSTTVPLALIWVRSQQAPSPCNPAGRLGDAAASRDKTLLQTADSQPTTGTTYSCVATYEGSNVEIIANEQGSFTTPSFVSFTAEERLIGEAAKNQAAMNPVNTVFDVKYAPFCLTPPPPAAGHVMY